MVFNLPFSINLGLHPCNGLRIAILAERGLKWIFSVERLVQILNLLKCGHIAGCAQQQGGERTEMDFQC